MKRMLILLLCVVAALSLSACGTAKEENTQLANPVVEYETLSDAEKAVGFTFTAPESFDDYSDRSVQVIGGKIAQITFRNEHDQRLVLRKAAGDEDISGDYNAYPQISEVDWEDRSATLKGEGDRFRVALWTAGDYTFSVTSDEPLSAGDMTALIAQIA